jgi:hypothetical protein
LESGKNLKQAITNGHAKTVGITWYEYDSATDSNLPAPAQAWQVIGDSDNGGAGIQFLGCRLPFFKLGCIFTIRDDSPPGTARFHYSAESLYQSRPAGKSDPLFSPADAAKAERVWNDL